MMNEEQYKTMIVEKYQGDFDHCYRLHQFVQAALVNNKWFTKNHHDAAHRPGDGQRRVQPGDDGGFQFAGRWDAYGGAGEFAHELLR